MFTRDSHPEPLPPAAGSLPPERYILDWIDSWRLVREDVLRLMAAYERADGGHDIGGFEPLLAEADAALRLLRHRVEWLYAHTGPAERSIG